MSRRVDLVSLHQMLDHAREAIDMIRGRTRADLDADRMFNLAVVRLLEIIGEAASRVSVPRRATLDEIPWTGIIGIRNRLIHGYDQVDFNAVWEVLTSDLSPLVAALEKAVPDEG